MDRARRGGSASSNKPAAETTQPSGPNHEAGVAAVMRMLTPPGPEPGLFDHKGTYQQAHGSAFVKEGADARDIDPRDITQGRVGDCWLLSAMAAIARENPELVRRLIRDNGDGSWNVTVYVPGGGVGSGWATKRAEVVRVDSWFPVQSHEEAYAQPGESRGQWTKLGAANELELWPMILEKAVAIAYGGYGQLDGSKTGTADGLETLMAGSATTRATNHAQPSAVLAEIAAALAQHRAVVTSSAPASHGTAKQVAELRILTQHTYSVKSVDVAAQTISLQNPWGKNDLDHLPIAEYVLLYDTYAIGGAS